ncbi:MAG: amylo-alpha-1,6-glucosidase [Spirochaetia bacterium]|nr:GH116 family glycosyl hydrolase [Spirochaetota bacterium]MDW8112253.1 amylo-alpha-1,6-glucosidase [Spirochaetia bacterium]
MKKLVLTFTIVSMLIVSNNLFGNEFFNTSKVELQKGDIRSFVFKDRLDGYYEGKTFSYASGEGYKVRNTVIFRDFVSILNDKPLNRREAPKTILYPSFFEALYNQTTERMFIIQHKQYVIVQLETQTPSKLGIIAILNWFRKDIQIKPINTTTIVIENTKIKSSTVPSYTVISSDKEVEFIQDPTNQLKEVRISPNFGNSGMIVSKSEVKEISFVVVFSTNEEVGIKEAESISKNLKSFLEGYKKELAGRVLGSTFETNLKEIIDKPMYWNLYSSDGFVVEEFGRGIWAGLPWFKNIWGRDTFISLPGCALVNGNFKDAKEIILNFAKFQDRGTLSIEITSEDEELLKQVIQDIRSINKSVGVRKSGNKLFVSVPSFLFSKSFSSKEELISKSKTLKESQGKYEIKETLSKSKTFGRVPNLVSSETSVQYNTTDGTPWFIREVMDYINYSGDLEFIKEIYPVIKTAIDGAIENFIDADGLLTHDDADTWMDARIEGKEAWSPRGNRAVEIQALWITSLEVGIFTANYMKDKDSAKRWEEILKKAKENFVKIFFDEQNKRIADRVRRDGFKDFKVRPNMLMTITVPFSGSIIGEEREAYILKNAVNELLYPYGIASLSQNDELFHPWHEKWELYHKDSAYHNGTVWVWNTGFTILSLLKFGYKELAYSLFTNTLNQVINEGYVGTLSELIDAIPQPNGRIKLSGTYSQAWSVAELSRAWYQGFIGFRPMLSQNKIILSPNLPNELKDLKASLKFGNEEYLVMEVKVTNDTEIYKLSLQNSKRTPDIDFIHTDDKGNRYVVSFTLDSKAEIKVDRKKSSITLNNKLAKPSVLKGYKDIIGELKFVVPKIPESNRVSKEKDYLKNKILNKEVY